MERLDSLESQLSEASDSAFELRCYKYSTYGYPVRIVCASFHEGDLVENWKPLNNAIATTLQAQIQDPVERYNIYLLIFESDISTELRAAIENDRYCCRKIVVREPMPKNDDTLETYVENRLFHFVGSASPQEKLQSVQSLIYSTDPSGQLFQLIANLKAHISAEDAQRAINIS
jgi:hypothetical protein